jgi:hypothetical protein
MMKRKKVASLFGDTQSGAGPFGEAQGKLFSTAAAPLKMTENIKHL